MLNVNNSLAKKINSENRFVAKGITSFPFFVPQYKEGGEVDLFKPNTAPSNQGLAQRLPQAASNAANQSRDLRLQTDKQLKSYMPKPDPYKVNLGQSPSFTAPSNVQTLGPTLIDSNMAAGIANNAANQYQGPYKNQVQSMFPQPNSQSRPGSLAEKVLGYKDGGKVEQNQYGMIEGQGTGKSDSIEADLMAHDYILPVEVVEMVGKDWLDSLVARIMQDEAMEGEGQPVEAMVSNGEYRVPKQVVEELGAEFFDKLKSMAGVPDLSKQVDGKPAYAYGDEVDEEKKRQQFEQQRNALYNENRQSGQGIVPSYTQAVTELNKPTLDQVKSIPNKLTDSFKVGYQDLFGGQTKQDQNLAQIKAPNLAQIQEQNKQPQFTQNQELSTPKLAERQEARASKPLNILGEQVQTLDARGGYKVRNPFTGAEGIEIPFSQSDDSALRRTLPASDYLDLQKQKRGYEDQLANSVIASSYEEDPGRYGVGVRSAQGGFSPNPVNLGSRQDNSADFARIALEQEKLSQPDYQTYTDEATGETRFYNRKGDDPAKLKRAYLALFADDATDEERKLARSRLDNYYGVSR